MSVLFGTEGVGKVFGTKDAGGKRLNRARCVAILHELAQCDGHVFPANKPDDPGGAE